MAGEVYSGYCRVPGCDHDPDNVTCSYANGTADMDYVESDRLPPGPGIVGEFTHPGTEIVRDLAGDHDWHLGRATEDIDAGGEGQVVLGLDYGYSNVQTVYARNMRLVPYRGCCGTLEDSTHLPECPSHYFVTGQVVVAGAVDFMLGSARMVMREDTVSSDRTFENETRLNPRKAEDWVF
jgi:hypothetical protein